MTEKIISINSMNKGDLKNLTKTQLINLILKQNNEIKVSQQQNAKPIPKPRTTKPFRYQGRVLSRWCRIMKTT